MRSDVLQCAGNIVKQNLSLLRDRRLNSRDFERRELRRSLHESELCFRSFLFDFLSRFFSLKIVKGEKVDRSRMPTHFFFSLPLIFLLSLHLLSVASAAAFIAAKSSSLFSSALRISPSLSMISPSDEFSSLGERSSSRLISSIISPAHRKHSQSQRRKENLPSSPTGFGLLGISGSCRLMPSLLNLTVKLIRFLSNAFSGCDPDAFREALDVLAGTCCISE